MNEAVIRSECWMSAYGALKQQSPYVDAIQQILERRRDEKHQPPPIAVNVPEKVKRYSIKPAQLKNYDKLSHYGNNPGDNDDD